MTNYQLQAITDKVRRALRNRAGASFSFEQLKIMTQYGILHELARLEADEFCRAVAVEPTKPEHALVAHSAHAHEANPSEAQPEPPAYSVAMLAERWGCSGALIRKMIKQGKLEKVQFGSLIRISAAEVARFESQAGT